MNEVLLLKQTGGWSLSGMLYVLAVEPLIHMICCELPNLSITNAENLLHLSAYADDINLFISNENDVKLILENVGCISSAKANWNKSDALLVGNWENARPNLPGGLLWRTEGIKYLGVFLVKEDFRKQN